MHAYGNASDDIKKGLIDEMYALSEFLDSEDNRNEYPALYDEDAIELVNKSRVNPFMDSISLMEVYQNP